MKTKFLRLSVLLLTLIVGIGQLWANKTYNSGDIIYYDFRNVASGSGDGVNYQGDAWEYDASGRGKLIQVVFSSGHTFKTTDGCDSTITISVEWRKFPDFTITTKGRMG